MNGMQMPSGGSPKNSRPAPFTTGPSSPEESPTHPLSASSESPGLVDPSWSKPRTGVSFKKPPSSYGDPSFTVMMRNITGALTVVGLQSSSGSPIITPTETPPSPAALTSQTDAVPSAEPEKNSSEPLSVQPLAPDNTSLRLPASAERSEASTHAASMDQAHPTGRGRHRRPGRASVLFGKAWRAGWGGRRM